MSDADKGGGVDPSQLALALERLRAVSSDVAEMKSSMIQMAGAVTRLAVMEERLGSSREALERAFREIVDLQGRVKTIEGAQPAHAQTSRWVHQVVGLMIAGVVGAVVSGVIRSPRESAPVPVIEQRK